MSARVGINSKQLIALKPESADSITKADGYTVIYVGISLPPDGHFFFELENNSISCCLPFGIGAFFKSN